MKNKNSIKLNTDEYEYLHQIIHDLSLQNVIDKNLSNFIELPKSICKEINNYLLVNTKRNKVEEFIKKKWKKINQEIIFHIEN